MKPDLSQLWKTADEQSMFGLVRPVFSFSMLFLVIAFAVSSPRCANAGDDASLVSQTVANGAVMTPGQSFTQNWTLRNTGTTTWSPGKNGYTLNNLGSDPYFGVGHHAKEVLGSPVAPGEEVTLSYDFIAPDRAGTYRSYWKMNSASNTFFGPTLVVEIVVGGTGGGSSVAFYATVTSKRQFSFADSQIGGIEKSYDWSATGLSVGAKAWGGANVGEYVEGYLRLTSSSPSQGPQPVTFGITITVPAEVGAPDVSCTGAASIHSFDYGALLWEVENQAVSGTYQYTAQLMTETPYIIEVNGQANSKRGTTNSYSKVLTINLPAPPSNPTPQPQPQVGVGSLEILLTYNGQSTDGLGAAYTNDRSTGGWPIRTSRWQSSLSFEHRGRVAQRAPNLSG